MEVEKQIREIIEFYCGGTYENRNTATKEICQNLQLQQTGVSGRSEQFSCPLPETKGCDRHKINDEEGCWEFCNTCKREWAR